WGIDVMRTVGYATSRRAYHGHRADSAPWRGRRSLGLNDRRAADPRLHGGTALRHAAVLGGTRRKPGREVPYGLGFECHGSARCLWAPTRRCSASVTRPRN